MTLPASAEYVIIYCGTDNLGHNSPLKIAEGLVNIACILKKNYKNLQFFLSCLLPRNDEKYVTRSVLYPVNCYLKELCTEQSHFIDLDSGWPLKNHLNTELFRSDNLHVNRKGYEKLSKLFIGKIESLQITVRGQNLKAPRNCTEAVSFSIVDDQFPPLLSVYQNSSKPVCTVNVCKPLPPVNPSKHIYSFNFSEPIRSVSSCKLVCPVDFSKPICTLDGLRLVCPVNFSKSVLPVHALKLVRSVNFNKIICPVNSDEPECLVNSSILVHPVNSSNFALPVEIDTNDSKKLLQPVNSSNVRLVDVRRPIFSVNSDKIVRTVNSNKPVNSKNVRPVDTRKSVCPVNSSPPVLPINSNNFVLPVDICTVDSKKPLRTVNSSKPMRPVDVHKPKPVNSKIVRSVDTRKPECPVNPSKPVLPIDVRNLYVL